MINNETIKETFNTNENEYWTNKLEGFSKTGFLYDNRKKKNKRLMVEEKTQFNQELYDLLIKISKASDVKIYMMLVSGLYGLLNKYTGHNDLTIGMPIYKQELEGDFINTVLALRNIIDQKANFKELLKQVRQSMIEAIENANYPMEAILYHMNLFHTDDDFPLFDVIVLLENIHDENYIKHVKPNIIFKFNRIDHRITLTCEYDSLLYSKETINRIMKHYTCFLLEALQYSDEELSFINILSTEEQKKILYDFNNTNNDYDSHKLLHELFEEVVMKYPENVALVSGDNTLSYGEFNAKANKLARYLREMDVKANVIVGIMANPSFEMMISILAVLKAGGTYLPIDPTYPVERINHMIQDSKLTIILRHDSSIRIDSDLKVLDLEELQLTSYSSENLTPVNSSLDAAYIIYTSGTTGKPKGVVIEHRSVINTLMYRWNAYEMNEDNVILQLFSYAFDGFVTSFFTPVISGAKIIIPGHQEVKDVEALKELIVHHKVTHFICIPALYEAIIDHLHPHETVSMKQVTLAGDKVSPHVLKLTKEKNENIEIINEYGVTEASVMSTIYRHQEQDTYIKIGKPIWNTKIYVLNEHKMLQPIGIPGEMYISGAGVAREYLYNEELTKQKFIKSPFCNDETMYSTGDMARWLNDGNIEYLGRMDNQVKIRGFRIELGEIENQLMENINIQKAIVVLREDGEEKKLCAYFTANKKLEINELKEELRENLPDYMIPASIMQLDKIRLTAHGKVDKLALPQPEYAVDAYEPPRDEIEGKLVELCSQVLKIDQENIGINDDFFDLGGHSLKATILATKINHKFNIHFPLQVIFKNPTIKGFGDFIKSTVQKPSKGIIAVEKREYYPLSSAQKRLYTIERYSNIGTSYNTPTVLKINGGMDMSKLEYTIQTLIERHDVLRTCFKTVDDEPMQYILEHVDFQIDILQLNGKGIDEVLEEYIQPFNLEYAPLMRVGIIELSKEEYLLIVDIHHIICDGTSIGILIREFAKIYSGEVLPPIKLQYKDYTCWQKQLMASEAYEKQKDYWLKLYSGEILRLDLATDYKRSDKLSYEGNSIYFKLNDHQTQGIRDINIRYRTTVYMNVLAMLNILLNKYTGQEDIIIGSGVMDRPHEDLNNIMGMFVNSLAMRNYPVASKTYSDFLYEVTERSVEALENQDMQFEELINELTSDRDTTRNPLFDIYLAVQNYEDSTINLSGMTNMTCSPYPYQHKTCKFDMTIVAYEEEDEITFKIEYATSLYKESTIRSLFKHYEEVIDQVIQNNDITIQEIMLTHNFANINDTSEYIIDEFTF